MQVILAILVIGGFVLLQRKIYQKYWARNLSFKFSFNRKTLYEGERVLIMEELENRKFLPLPWLEINITLPRSFISERGKYIQSSETQYRTDIFALPGNKRLVMETGYICAARGFYRIPDIKAESFDLLMGGPSRMNFAADASVTVFPRPLAVSELEVPYNKITGDIAMRRFILPDPFEFRGIREYQPYDSFRDINFKASARTGELMSNVFDPTVTQEILIILNVQKYSHVINYPVCEDAIRLAAFLAGYYIGEGIPVSFATNGRDCVSGGEAMLRSGLSRTHLTNIYEALARIDLSMIPKNLTELPNLTFGNTDDRVVIVISGYGGADLVEWYDKITAEGRTAMWIAPRGTGEGQDVPTGRDIVLWEAGRLTGANE
ncbi:MAG: DUF58 domain-containing protein [Clostridiales bacterium]|jgi:uncharacterized protein (DUF58 family)|nr:DUF58 domain-containing protein [Clostridiales bacterium]